MQRLRRRSNCPVQVPEGYGCAQSVCEWVLNEGKLLTKVFKVLLLSERKSIKPAIGYRKMPSRITIVRTLGIALVSLLLCAIFASELPELLSLADNTANDYALRSADSLVLPGLCSAIDVRKSAVKFNISTQDSRLGTPESTELAPLHLCVPYTVLRT
jgi:hypothetical protein